MENTPRLDTSPLNDPDRQRVEALCQQEGVKEAARQLGVGKDSLIRLLAKQPLRRGTVALIRSALQHLAATKQEGQI